MSASEPLPPPRPPEWVPPPPSRWPAPETADTVDALLLARRVVVVSGRLDAALAEQTVAKLLLLDRDDASAPVTMHLSCAEADLLPALDVAAAIDLARPEVTAIATGSVGGAAVAAYSAAPHRLAHPHTLFVLSEPRVEIDGSAEHIAVEAEQHRQRLAELHHRVASATGRSADDVAADLRTGRVLGAAEAEAYGLVHEVTQSHRT